MTATGWTTRLLEGLAADLATAGVGSWSPTAVFDEAGTTPVIALRSLPPAPDQALALTTYVIADADDPGGATILTGVQIRVRGTTDPSTADDIADAAYDLLHGRRMSVIGGIPVALTWRQSGALLGPDTSGRYERTENYYAYAERPTAARPD